MSQYAERLKKIIDELDSITSELKNEEYNWRFENARRILEYTRSRIFLAEETLNGKITMPFSPGDTPDHVLGREHLLRYLAPEDRIPWEVPLGGHYKPDAIIKVEDSWGILEVETDPRKCEKDFKGVNSLLQNPEKLSHNTKTIQGMLDEIKKQILDGIPVMLYLGLIKGTMKEEYIRKRIEVLKNKYSKVNVKVYLIDVELGEISEIKTLA